MKLINVNYRIIKIIKFTIIWADYSAKIKTMNQFKTNINFALIPNTKTILSSAIQNIVRMRFAIIAYNQAYKMENFTACYVN